MELYILAGQSNMAGRGDIEELPERYTRHRADGDNDGTERCLRCRAGIHRSTMCSTPHGIGCGVKCTGGCETLLICRVVVRDVK